jgi:hypothetical protein
VRQCVSVFQCRAGLQSRRAQWAFRPAATACRAGLKPRPNGGTEVPPYSRKAQSGMALIAVTELQRPEVLAPGAVPHVELQAHDREEHRVRAIEEQAVLDCMEAEIGGKVRRAAAVPADAVPGLRVRNSDGIHSSNDTRSATERPDRTGRPAQGSRFTARGSGLPPPPGAWHRPGFGEAAEARRAKAAGLRADDEQGTEDVM